MYLFVTAAWYLDLSTLRDVFTVLPRDKNMPPPFLAHMRKNTGKTNVTACLYDTGAQTLLTGSRKAHGMTMTADTREKQSKIRNCHKSFNYSH
jgi:hypothetical protein